MIDNTRRAEHGLDQQCFQRTGDAERIIVVVWDDIIRVTMKGENGDVAGVQKGRVGHGTPHVDEASDAEVSLDGIATGINVAKIGAKEAPMGVFRAGLIGHEGEVEYGDGPGTGTSHEDHGGIDAIFLLMRNQITHGGMGILHRTIARTANTRHGGKESYPIVDGGGHIPL